MSHGLWAVQLVDTGDGIAGKYNPADPEDIPVLRVVAASSRPYTIETVLGVVTMLPVTTSEEDRTLVAGFVQKWLEKHFSLQPASVFYNLSRFSEIHLDLLKRRKWHTAMSKLQLVTRTRGPVREPDKGVL